MKRRPPASRTPPLPCAQAFSLVEVTIAMGIFVFALVAILGLLPTALQTSRRSLDLSAATQLANTLVSGLEREEFSSLKGKAGTSEEHFFDDLGNELPSQDGAVYLADVAVLPSESVNLLRAKIAVRRGEDAPVMRTFSFLIFNND